MPSGFEMLVNNFSSGIIGMVLAIVSFYLIGPFVTGLSEALAWGVNTLVGAGLLPLTSIFVEPAKILFLNNAINHGIFSPLGIQQSTELGQSIFFLIEANPGPGLGLLLAYMVFGKGTAKQTAGGATIIHFFGGIHEIYFPYVLMNPRLILAVIAGGMTGVFTLTLFNAGLLSPASPGSIFAVLLLTPKASLVGVVLSVIASAAVSFVVASLLMKTQKDQAEDEGDKLAEASNQMKNLKNAPAAQANSSVNMGDVTKIIVACDAGMGSSAMGASLLAKKVKSAGLNISVTNSAINNLPNDVDIVITHKDLTPRAIKHADQAKHLSLTNFLDSALYDGLVSELLAASNGTTTATDTVEEVQKNVPVFELKEENIFLGLKASNKLEAIKFAGEQLVKLGYAEPAYIDGMFEREKLVTTYLGESIAVPHGTIEAKESVIKTGIVVCQYTDGILFGDDEDDIAKLVIGIAAKNDEHISVITTITNALDDEKAIETLINSKDVQKVLSILS